MNTNDLADTPRRGKDFDLDVKPSSQLSYHAPGAPLKRGMRNMLALEQADNEEDEMALSKLLRR